MYICKKRAHKGRITGRDEMNDKEKFEIITRRSGIVQKQQTLNDVLGEMSANLIITINY